MTSAIAQNRRIVNIQPLTNIQIEEPDFCHTVGQFLLLPEAVVLGRTFCVQDRISESKHSTFAKVIMVFLSVFLIPIAVTLVGMVLLSISKTHKVSYDRIQNQELRQEN